MVTLDIIKNVKKRREEINKIINLKKAISTLQVGTRKKYGRVTKETIVFNEKYRLTDLIHKYLQELCNLNVITQEELDRIIKQKESFDIR